MELIKYCHWYSIILYGSLIFTGTRKRVLCFRLETVSNKKMMSQVDDDQQQCFERGIKRFYATIAKLVDRLYADDSKWNLAQPLNRDNVWYTKEVGAVKRTKAIKSFVALLKID